MAQAVSACPECGASWAEGPTCDDHFHQMLYWEAELGDVGTEVHFLMVASFHLQHPSRYSPEALAGVKEMLAQVLEHGVTTQDLRRQLERRVDSGARQFKVRGSPESHGSYARPVRWTRTAADVVAAGKASYTDSVYAWARTVLSDLRASGNL